ncbi:MAG: glycosyltransferase [Peptococcaceae bacterium]|jgi:glycosyltransferase involved in cell wall biosynthesis|nr:glycosyltransferase [Peptococcaceae bacterium]
MNNKISLCMIVKDEEKNIRRCLASVAGAVDEIIVVDTGSQDDTCALAVAAGARVYRHPWNGSFAESRNASLEPATGEWILFLDADEELAAGGREVLRRLVDADDDDVDVEGYFVKIVNYLGGEGWIEPSPDLVFRLFRNRREYRFHGAIHEQIVDVILAQNPGAGYRIAQDLEIIHYGYLDSHLDDKDKKARNLGLIRQELANDPENRLLRYHYGVELFRAERHREAAAELTAAARGIDPHTVYLPKLLRYIVLAHFAAGGFGEAMETIRLGLSLFPDYADLHYYAGLIAFEEKRYGEAHDYFLRTVSLPGQPPYYAPFFGLRGFRSYFYLGRLGEVFRNEDQALQYYIASLRDNPSFMPALENLVRLLKPREDPENAGLALEGICDFCTPQAHLSMARILFRQSAYRLALVYIDRYTAQQEPQPEVTLWQAICLFQQKRFLEALRILDGFAPGQDIHPLARLNKLLCFWLQGNTRKMRPLVDELFAMGLSLDTGAVVGLLRDSLHKRRGPRVSLADEGTALLLDITQRALDLGARDRVDALLAGLTPEYRRENGRALGQMFFRYGFPADAQTYFSLFLEANPADAGTLAQLAEVKASLGDFPAAAGLYRKAIAADPAEPGHYLGLIGIYDRMRLDVLREAAGAYPDVPVFRTLLEGGPA